LHVEVGPGLAVDLDDVAEERVGLAGGVDERPVAFVFFGREDERDVELTVSGGKTETVLGWVVDDVPACLAVPGIFSGLWGCL